MWKENCKNLNSNGITLIALVITIIVLLILAGVTIATLTGDNGILNQAGKAKDKTTEAESIERVQVEVVGSYGLDGTIDKDQLNKNLKNINGLTYNGNALSDSNKIADLPATVTLNGYDIVIDGNGNVSKKSTLADKSGANEPNVTNIAQKTYVTWTNNNGTYEINDTQTTQPSDWYDYENGQWANIKTAANGLTAYWVWIPRFEYIVPTSTKATQIDVKFISKSKITPDDGYTIHPAFTFNNQQLDGIWVAKFEASSNAPKTVADGGSNSPSYQVQVLPNASSWRTITTKNIFTVCRNIQSTSGVLAGSTNIDSHMMKNMEWGAVAILSQSKYGVFNPKSENGGQVWNNPYYQCKSYAFDNTKENDLDTSVSVSDNNIIKTGCAATTAGNDAGNTTSCDSYNTGNGPKASTTGTVYGVYDMAGGSLEYVAGCISGYENSKFGVTRGDSTYVDLYTNASNSSSDYPGAKIGDATAETKGWNGDCAYFPVSSYPVFIRGGAYDHGTIAGVFYFYINDGVDNYDHSFRPVWVAF